MKEEVSVRLWAEEYMQLQLFYVSQKQQELAYIYFKSRAQMHNKYNKLSVSHEHDYLT